MNAIVTSADFIKGTTALAAKWDKMKAIISNELARRAWETAIRQAELTQEEWYSAISAAIAELVFLPSPKELIELVRSSKMAQSILDWTAIQNTLSLPHEEQREALLQLSPRAKTALQAIGGIGSIKFADQKRLGTLEKDFKTVYLQSSSQDCKVLAPASVNSDSERHIQISQDWEFIKRAFAYRDNPEWRDSELKRLSSDGKESFARSGGVAYLTPDLMPVLWRNFSCSYQFSGFGSGSESNGVSSSEEYITPDQFRWLQNQIKVLSKGSTK